MSAHNIESAQLRFKGMQCEKVEGKKRDIAR